MNFIIVTGARPNFMKIAPLCKEFDKENIEYNIFNSGQHYDITLNDIFQKQFNLKHIYNNIISHENKIISIQNILYDFRNFLIQKDPTAVIVVGDVDTTFCAALVTKSLGKKLIHIESGLRSFDYSMPEEKNRIVADHISNVLFCSFHEAERNLYNEGIEKNIYMVGNIMIDCLINFLPEIEDRKKRINPYIVATFHRPENIDTEKLFFITRQLKLLKEYFDIVFPVHPRTMKQLKNTGYINNLDGCIILEPLSYIDFMAEIFNAKAIITDSGGIQEETTYLNIPCFTVRNSTERPITITEGTNKLIKIEDIAKEVLNPIKKQSRYPKYWDGQTSKRIIKILKEIL